MSQEVRWNLAHYRSAEKLGLQKFITSQRHAGFPPLPSSSSLLLTSADTGLMLVPFMRVLCPCSADTLTHF